MLSAGTATSFGLNASAVPFENINAALFSLSTLCWPILYYTAFNNVTDTNYGKESEVVVPIRARYELGLESKDTEIDEAHLGQPMLVQNQRTGHEGHSEVEVMR